VTRASVADRRQERQLIAGRYRLASLHRGDDSSEVWRALDESTTQVVSLEFLRDPDPTAKERFLAGARRLASVAQPSVMRVAAIHDDRDGTFIVFEHLVKIPVPTEWLEPAVAAPSPILGTAAPAAIVEPTATPATTATLEVVPGEPAAQILDETATDRGLSLLLFALRTRELSLVDMALLQESAVELATLTRDELAAVRLDPTVIDDLRTFVQNVDISAVLSAPAGAAKAAGRLFIRRSRTNPPAQDASYPTHVKKIRIAHVVPVHAAKPRAPSRLVGRVRLGRVLIRGIVGGLLVTVLMTMPPDVAAKLASEVASTAGIVATEAIATIGSVATDVSSTIGAKLAEAQPADTLARASFEVPPLSAYGAAFEAQAPYPNARPNAQVEWVVALRNTGSAGWYRGIDGAQASLVFADGTTAGVQTTAYVGPGQVGWFIVHFTAPSQAGTSKIKLLPRIDGRGSLPDLGIYATVTVSPNP